MLVMIALHGCAYSNSYVKHGDRLKDIEKVAIIPFRCENPSIGESIADSLSARLTSSRWDVIERAQLERILEEQHLSLTGVMENQQIVVGKIKGIDAIITGQAVISNGFAGLLYGGNIDYVSNAVARVIDVNTGEVLLAATFTSTNASTMSGVTAPVEVGLKLAKRLLRK